MADYIGTIKGTKVYAVNNIKELKEIYPLPDNILYLVEDDNLIIRENYIIGEYNPRTQSIDLYIHPEYIDLEPSARTLTDQIKQEIRKENDWIEPLDLDTYLRNALTAKEVGGIKLGI